MSEEDRQNEDKEQRLETGEGKVGALSASVRLLRSVPTILMDRLGDGQGIRRRDGGNGEREQLSVWVGC